MGRPRAAVRWAAGLALLLSGALYAPPASAQFNLIPVIEYENNPSELTLLPGEAQTTFLTMHVTKDFTGSLCEIHRSLVRAHILDGPMSSTTILLSGLFTTYTVYTPTVLISSSSIWYSTHVASNFFPTTGPTTELTDVVSLDIFGVVPTTPTLGMPAMVILVLAIGTAVVLFVRRKVA